MIIRQRKKKTWRYVTLKSGKFPIRVCHDTLSVRDPTDLDILTENFNYTDDPHTFCQGKTWISDSKNSLDIRSETLVRIRNTVTWHNVTLMNFTWSDGVTAQQAPRSGYSIVERIRLCVDVDPWNVTEKI